MRDRSAKKPNGVGFTGDGAAGDEDDYSYGDSGDVAWVYEDWSESAY